MKVFFFATGMCVPSTHIQCFVLRICFSLQGVHGYVSATAEAEKLKPLLTGQANIRINIKLYSTF